MEKVTVIQREDKTMRDNLFRCLKIRSFDGKWRMQKKIEERDHHLYPLLFQTADFLRIPKGNVCRKIRCNQSQKSHWKFKGLLANHSYRKVFVSHDKEPRTVAKKEAVNDEKIRDEKRKRREKQQPEIRERQQKWEVASLPWWSCQWLKQLFTVMSWRWVNFFFFSSNCTDKKETDGWDNIRREMSQEEKERERETEDE